MSSRAQKPFIKVNCGAIPESLIDDELFGHEKGAFTDAKAMRKGYFEQANGGTLFLDEIGDLSLAVQLRLLRVLQYKTITRIGAEKSIKLDIRIIAATHCDLEQMVAQGDFREDLWYRLNVFPIEVPPLRERAQDILPLAKHFLSTLQRKYHLPQEPILSDETLHTALQYDWPGNIRELENLLERAILQGQNTQVRLHLAKLPSSKQVQPESQYKTSSSHDGVKSLDAMTKEYLQQILDLCNGKIAGKNGAAEKMGLHPNTLRSKMKRLGMLS